MAGATATLALACATALSTLLVVGLGLGDALDGVRTMSRLVWHLGLPVMLLGHALMLVAALVGVIMQSLREVVLGE